MALAAACKECGAAWQGAPLHDTCAHLLWQGAPLHDTCAHLLWQGAPLHDTCAHLLCGLRSLSSVAAAEEAEVEALTASSTEATPERHVPAVGLTPSRSGRLGDVPARMPGFGSVSAGARVECGALHGTPRSPVHTPVRSTLSGSKQRAGPMAGCHRAAALDGGKVRGGAKCSAA
jgi:hypothetical protein